MTDLQIIGLGFGFTIFVGMGWFREALPNLTIDPPLDEPTEKTVKRTSLMAVVGGAILGIGSIFGNTELVVIGAVGILAGTASTSITVLIWRLRR